jgi:glucosyl-dolichyl phosphate glucuronosyltransferase
MSQIDIVVCSYNEGRYLQGLLDSLCRQTADPHSFRVLFVDNGSSDNTREVLELYRDRLDLEYIFEPRLGLNIARNVGFQNARTDYVAYTDGDAVLSPNWVETILKVIDQSSPDLFGGPYLPYYVRTKPAWFKDQYNSLNKGSEMRLLNGNDFLSGINMIWKRQILERLGGFNSAVGLAGRGRSRGAETNLMVIARSQIPDFTVLYCPDLVVYHLTRPQTFSMLYWLKRNFLQGFRYHAVWEVGSSQQFLPALKRYLFFLRELTKKTISLNKRDKNLFPAWQNYIYEQVFPEVQRNGKLFSEMIQALKRTGKKKNQV